MAGVKYRITGGLTQEQIEIMHQKDLQLIGEAGLNVPHERMRRILANYEGVTVERDSVRFQPHRVERAIVQQSYPGYVKGDDFIINLFDRPVAIGF